MDAIQNNICSDWRNFMLMCKLMNHLKYAPTRSMNYICTYLCSQGDVSFKEILQKTPIRKSNIAVRIRGFTNANFTEALDLAEHVLQDPDLLNYNYNFPVAVSALGLSKQNEPRIIEYASHPDFTVQKAAFEALLLMKSHRRRPLLLKKILASPNFSTQSTLSSILKAGQEALSKDESDFLVQEFFTYWTQITEVPDFSSSSQAIIMRSLERIYTLLRLLEGIECLELLPPLKSIVTLYDTLPKEMQELKLPRQILVWYLSNKNLTLNHLPLLINHNHSIHLTNTIAGVLDTYCDESEYRIYPEDDYNLNYEQRDAVLQNKLSTTELLKVFTTHFLHTDWQTHYIEFIERLNWTLPLYNPPVQEFLLSILPKIIDRLQSISPERCANLIVGSLNALENISESNENFEDQTSLILLEKYLSLIQIAPEYFFYELEGLSFNSVDHFVFTAHEGKSFKKLQKTFLKILPGYLANMLSEIQNKLETIQNKKPAKNKRSDWHSQEDFWYKIYSDLYDLTHRINNAENVPPKVFQQYCSILHQFAEKLLPLQNSIYQNDPDYHLPTGHGAMYYFTHFIQTHPRTSLNPVTSQQVILDFIASSLDVWKECPENPSIIGLNNHLEKKSLIADLLDPGLVPYYTFPSSFYKQLEDYLLQLQTIHSQLARYTDPDLLQLQNIHSQLAWRYNDAEHFLQQQIQALTEFLEAQREYDTLTHE